MATEELVARTDNQLATFLIFFGQTDRHAWVALKERGCHARPFFPVRLPAPLPALHPGSGGARKLTPSRPPRSNRRPKHVFYSSTAYTRSVGHGGVSAYGTWKKEF